ncbi:hypothetical protein DRJ48_00045 [Candidatus Woesearchaeota archaeon]|nr:MAG: hypothetical protein DRJ48_00045 [Candidatus Woesearchaeota archaeon]
MEKLENQPCPVCKKNTCTLTEEEMDVPYFGKVYIFSMQCSNCGFKKSDVEAAERHKPVKWSFTVEGDEDLSVRVVKSSEAKVKIRGIVEITPGPDSEGYVTNVEGLLNRVKHRIEASIEDEDDPEVKKRAWKHIKKLNKVLVGREKLRITIEDPSGNSAIISEKAEKSKLK